MKLLPAALKDALFKYNFRQAVTRGMWPYRPEAVYVRVDFDVTYQKYYVLVEIKGYKDWQFNTTVDLVDLAAMEDPDEFAFLLGMMAVENFRRRPTRAIPENVELGEN